MAKNAEVFELTCPCCEAMLKIDPGTRAVIAHTPKPVPKTFNDFEEAARSMKSRRAAKNRFSGSRWKLKKTRQTCWTRSSRRDCGAQRKHPTAESLCVTSI